MDEGRFFYVDITKELNYEGNDTENDHFVDPNEKLKQVMIIEVKVEVNEELCNRACRLLPAKVTEQSWHY